MLTLEWEYHVLSFSLSTVSYIFSTLPHRFCLSAPKTDMDNNVVVSDYAAMDRILRDERKYILNMCKKIKKSGANVVLIQKSILRDAYNELSLHFLAKMGILVVTDIERTDVEFVCRTLGCTPVPHVDSLSPEKLGSAEHVGDVVLPGSGHKVVKFVGVANPGRTSTVLLRGSNELVLAEANRSVHDAQVSDLELLCSSLLCV